MLDHMGGEVVARLLRIKHHRPRAHPARVQTQCFGVGGMREPTQLPIPLINHSRNEYVKDAFLS